MKFIDSYIANRNWIKAHALMGDQFHSLALLAIRKAVDIEPDIEKVPAYLELQGHIESSIGKIEMALRSFQRAVQIISENPELFHSKESKKLGERIKAAIAEMKTLET
jgi:tetratricopeptide (TPR) repeat protein